MLFFLFEGLLDFGPDLELILDFFVGHFIDLGFVEVVAHELGRCELSANLYFLLNLWDLCVHPDEVLVVVPPAQPYDIEWTTLL